MLKSDKSSPEVDNIQELEEFLSKSKEVREWKRGQAVKLRMLGCSYQEIRVALGVSTSFIAQILRRYSSQGISGLKLGYMGSKSYLKSEEILEIIDWLQLPERRNISELERQIIEEYDVVFRSRESDYQILRKAKLTWQKANKENPRKKPEVIEEQTINREEVSGKGHFPTWGRPQSQAVIAIEDFLTSIGVVANADALVCYSPMNISHPKGENHGKSDGSSDEDFLDSHSLIIPHSMTILLPIVILAFQSDVGGFEPSPAIP